MKCGESKDEIAKELGVHRSTIYRELRCNSRKGGVYYPDFAQELTNEKKECFCRNRKLDDYKKRLIDNWNRPEQWSPEQIKTPMLMMRKLKHGKNADKLAKTVIDMLRPYKEYVKSITSDNGTEFARHQKITKALDTEFFFAHPYAS